MRVLTRREHADADLDDELTHYLDEATEAHLARGLSPDEARRAARREVGAPIAVREQVRDYGWENAVATLLRRPALRGAHAPEEPGLLAS